MKHSLGARSGFTLIELLIVVAIISILASIAIPSMTEAQTRAKVARIHADMRTIMMGLETYMLDNNEYPVRHSPRQYLPHLGTQAAQMKAITTPIAYLTTLPVDIFAKDYQWPNNAIDYWDSRQTKQFLAPQYGVLNWEFAPDYTWVLVSVGPDRIIGAPTPKYLDYPNQGGGIRSMWWVYDPTNGTISSGNIYRFHGDRNPTDILAGNYRR